MCFIQIRIEYCHCEILFMSCCYLFWSHWCPIGDRGGWVDNVTDCLWPLCLMQLLYCFRFKIKRLKLTAVGCCCLFIWKDGSCMWVRRNSWIKWRRRHGYFTGTVQTLGAKNDFVFHVYPFRFWMFWVVVSIIIVNVSDQSSTPLPQIIVIEQLKKGEI